jgi:hypothetical protein
LELAGAQVHNGVAVELSYCPPWPKNCLFGKMRYLDDVQYRNARLLKTPRAKVEAVGEFL